MCTTIRFSRRPAGCLSEVVALCDGQTVEAFFIADVGSRRARGGFGVPTEPDEEPSVDLVDVLLGETSILEDLADDDCGYIVDQLLRLDRPDPAAIRILARRPSSSFVEEQAEPLAVQQARALQLAEGDIDADGCDFLAFPTLAAVAIPELPRAA